LAAAVALAVVAELVQLLGIRSVSAGDAGANVVGIALGAATGWLPSRVVGLLMAVMVVIALLLGFPIRTNMSNWDLSFPLTLANELTGDRPWRGDLSELALFGRALTPEEVAYVSEPGAAIRSLGPELFYSFGDDASLHEEPGGVMLGNTLPLHVTPPARVASGTGLTIDEPAIISSQDPPTRLYAAVQESNAVSMMVRFRPRDLTATGPARIVTLSVDPYRRNLTLGQQGDSLHLRVRDSLSDDNGVRPVLVIKRCLTTKATQTVVAVVDRGQRLLYVDGRLRGRVCAAAIHLLLAELSSTGMSTPATWPWALVGWSAFTLGCARILLDRLAPIPSVSIAAGMALLTVAMIRAVQLWAAP